MSLTQDSMAAWRWFAALALAVATAVLVGTGVSATAGTAAAGFAPGAVAASVAPQIQAVAQTAPQRSVDVIVQLQRGTSLATGRDLMAGAGATGLRDVRLINAVAGTMTARDAVQLASLGGIRAISLDAPVKATSFVPGSSALRTSYNESIGAEKAWAKGFTGAASASP